MKKRTFYHIIAGILTFIFILGLFAPAFNVKAAEDGYFNQGLWRGQDPRISYDPTTGYYYYVEDSGSGMVIFRSKSIIERNGAEERRTMRTGFPLAAPVYVSEMNGVTYNKWYCFGNSVWECDGDPFTGKWTQIGGMGLKAYHLDYYAFCVEEGEEAGNWYFVWAQGEDTNSSAFSAEHLHISKMTSPTTLENNSPGSDTLLLKCQKALYGNGGWSGWDVEAVSVTQKNGTVTLLYSGTDCKTNEYAIGRLVYLGDIHGNGMSNHNNWYNIDVTFPGFSQTYDTGEDNTQYGTGVPAVVKSKDGTEDWMFYNAKRYAYRNCDTEAWTRIICAVKILYKDVTIEGVNVTVPDFENMPVGNFGDEIQLPSGDPGITETGYYFFEAEHAVPFGNIYSAAVRGASGDDGEPLNLMYEKKQNASLRGSMSHFDLFAKGDANGYSGLTFRNVPAAKSMVIAAGSEYENGGFDIIVNGEKKASVSFLQTLDTSNRPYDYIFKNYRVSVDIPKGSTVELRYVKDVYDDSAVDFVVFENEKQYECEITVKGGSEEPTEEETGAPESEEVTETGTPESETKATKEETKESATDKKESDTQEETKPGESPSDKDISESEPETKGNQEEDRKKQKGLFDGMSTPVIIAICFLTGLLGGIVIFGIAVIALKKKKNPETEDKENGKENK